MGNDLSSEFDFQLDEGERGELLKQAKTTVGSLSDELGESPSYSRSGGPGTSEQAALNLIDQFDQAVAEFSGSPDVIPLEETHFTEHGLPLPLRFQDLRKKGRFYWIRFPVVLKPAPGTAFTKLQCGVHFNPGTTEPHLLPRTVTVLPDRKFQEMLKGDLELDVRINEKFEFEANAGHLASVDTKGAAGAGLVAGPFHYSWKRALVDHTAPGAEKVFWTLTDSQFSQNDELAFVVVVQVPEGVEKVEIAGALRAYHSADITANLGDVLQYFGKRLISFFKAGAPTTAPPTVWNITPSL